MTVIMANDLPWHSNELDPFVSLGNVLAFDSRDWGRNRADSWIWGIVLGWGLEALKEQAAKHGWSERDVRRLRLLHLAFRRAEVHGDIGSAS